MYEQIDERVKVVAFFGKHHKEVEPLKFIWGNREFTLTKLGYHYKYKEGRALVHVFSGTDGTSFFELKFNTEDLSWFLGRVADHETH